MLMSAKTQRSRNISQHILNKSDVCFKIFTNNSLEDANNVLMAIIYAFGFVFILFSNILMIVGLLKTNKQLSISKKLFLSLSVSDLLTGMLTVPIQLFMVMNGTESDCALVAAQAFVNAFFPSLSMLILVVISLFRYAIITNNTKAAKFTTPAAVKFIFVLQILFSIAYAIWYTYVSQTLDHVHHAVFLIFTSAYVVIVVTGMIVLNVRLLFYIKTTGRTSTVRFQQNIAQYHSKVTKTILIITIVVILCYLPLMIIFATMGIFLLDKNSFSEYYHYMIPWSHLPLVYNSGMNSIVYISRNERIIRYFKRMISKTDSLLENSDLINETSALKVKNGHSAHNRTENTPMHLQLVPATEDEITSSMIPENRIL